MTVADRFDAIVIGAGANGLVAAATLAAAGRRTLVVERSDVPGGQARSLEFAPGFRAAPLALDAEWIPPGVARQVGVAMPERVYPEVPLTLALPGESLSLAADPRRAAEAIRLHSARDADAWSRFTAQLYAMASFLGELYQRPAPDVGASAPTELLGLAGLAWRFRRLGRRAMAEFLRTVPLSIAELLDDWFESATLKAALAPRGVRDIRQGPRSGGTAFVWLHRLVGAPAGSVNGAGYWRTAPDAINVMLEAAARRQGVTIRTGAPVSEIRVRDDAVAGVMLESGEEIDAPTVLSSTDAARTVLDLVDPVWLDPEFLLAVKNIKFRGATAFVLYALGELPHFSSLPDATSALAGSVTLTPTVDALEQAYDATKYGAVPERPHVEITAPSLRWSTLAPPDKHVLVARAAYAPYALREGPWNTARREGLADRVTDAISCVAPGFADRIEHRAVLVPPDLESVFGLTDGAASHGELTLDQILFMRPVARWARYATPVDGLYLCGASTHPGPGVVGGPGWLAARRVLGR